MTRYDGVCSCVSNWVVIQIYGRKEGEILNII